MKINGLNRPQHLMYHIDMLKGIINNKTFKHRPDRILQVGLNFGLIVMIRVIGALLDSKCHYFLDLTLRGVK